MLTEYDKSIIIGLIIGDGYINNKGRICIEHGEKQFEYCVYKAKLLHSICGGNDIIVHKNNRHVANSILHKCKSKSFITYSFKKQSKNFIFFRELMYKNNKKVITEEVLKYIQPISIALWWMDDGCLYKRYNKGYKKHSYFFQLSTFCSLEEIKLIQTFFIDKYDIKWNIKKQVCKNDIRYSLCCGQKQGKKLLQLIKQYVYKVDCMKYKCVDI